MSDTYYYNNKNYEINIIRKINDLNIGYIMINDQMYLVFKNDNKYDWALIPSGLTPYILRAIYDYLDDTGLIQTIKDM